MSPIAVATLVALCGAGDDSPLPMPALVLTKSPELLQFVEAAYPQGLFEAGTSGAALLTIDIDAEGDVDRVALESATHPEFGAAALLAAAQFRFSPAWLNGEPSGVRIEYRYVFAAPARAPAPAEGPANLLGRVLEAGNRRPLAGVSVSIDNGPHAITDINGSFALRGAPTGDFTVSLTSPFHRAYRSHERRAEDERLEVTYHLYRIAFDPYRTVVHSKAERREVARVRLDRRELSHVPGTSGDPLRVIENLPGLNRTPGGLGGALLVRGANPTDSRVFIDGVEVPLIYHFGGLTSVVNASMLERIDFYPGGFGVRYGGSIAGIVDVASRDIDCDLVHGAGDISLLHAATDACVPVGDNWRVMAAARRSYVDLWLKPLLDNWPRDADEGFVTLAPVYWDYQVKTQARYGAHAFDALLFGSDDRFKLIQTGSSEDVNFNFNLQLSFHRLNLRHRVRLNDRLTLHSLVSPGVRHDGFRGSADEIGLDNRFDVELWGTTWREELSAKLFDHATVRLGLDVNQGLADVSYKGPFPTTLGMAIPTPTFDFTQAQSFSESMTGLNHGYWLEGDLTSDFGLRVTAGLRFDRWDVHHTQDYSLQPRLSTRYEIAPGMIAKAAYGIYEKLPEPQFLVSRPFGNPKLDPMRAHHFVVGYEHAFTDVIHLDLQGFYNLREHLQSPSNVVTYRDGKVIPEVWSSEGKGRTYGMEILLRHLSIEGGLFYGWLAYTLSRAEQTDRFRDATQLLQEGPGTQDYGGDSQFTYPAPFDQTHILTLVGQFLLPLGFEAGFRFRFVSGNPYTPLAKGTVSYDADSDSYVVDLSGVERNSARMPTFHQLDLRVDKLFTFAWWKLGVYLELLNAYNQANVEQYQYDYRYEKRTPLTFLPILPILGVKGEF